MDTSTLSDIDSGFIKRGGMNTNIASQLDELTKLDEDTFSSKILKPLFEAMGYERVDFYGGPYEKGRDLVATKRLPPEVDPYVVFVQSKKIKQFKTVAKTAPEFSRLLHQLRQLVSGELELFNGARKKADKIYFACPEKIGQRLKDEILTQFHGMSPVIELIDGIRVLDLIRGFKPELFDLITPIGKLLIPDADSPNIKNDELNEALHFFTDKELIDYYCDLSFFAGSFDTNTLFHLELDVFEKCVELDEPQWHPIKTLIETVERVHGIVISKESVEEIESRHAVHNKEFLGKKNKQRLHELDNLRADKVAIERKVGSLISELKDKNSTSSHTHGEQIDGVISRLTEYLAGKPVIDTAFDFPSGEELKGVASTIYGMIVELKEIESRIERQSREIVSSPKFVFELSKTAIMSYFDTERSAYFQGVARLNSGSSSSAEIKHFLEKTRRFLGFLNLTRKLEDLSSNLLRYHRGRETDDRIKISPVAIFDSGGDVAVYGGAGVGKTTTLKKYALIASQNDKKLIYLALNRYVESVKAAAKQASGTSDTFQEDMILKLILLNMGKHATGENVEVLKAYLSDPLVLILDGLDEVYNSMDGIIPAINRFKSQYSNVQLIVSSRDCVSYLDDIDFLGITLNPFTDQQLETFVHNRLSDRKKAESLISEIQKRNSYDFIRTPLLATIMCSLSENGIVDASSEYSVYSKRLKLLTGEYDRYKGIKRQDAQPEILQKVARTLAFAMHKEGVRELIFREMSALASSELSPKVEGSVVEDCIRQLINPCNILILNAVTGLLSFGHFRFQEQLAAEVVAMNRGIRIVDLIVQDWWSGALILYAQENRVESVFDELSVCAPSVILKGAKTLKSMLDVRPGRERTNLISLFEMMVEQANFERGQYDDF